jgi:predicted SprT family Zn-dependent metalloprotease
MADQIDRIREEMFAKFEEDEKRKQERIEHAQSQCEHSYTTRSRVSSDGKSQILGCGKCGHKILKERS